MHADFSGCLRALTRLANSPAGWINHSRSWYRLVILTLQWSTGKQSLTTTWFYICPTDCTELAPPTVHNVFYQPGVTHPRVLYGSGLTVIPGLSVAEHKATPHREQPAWPAPVAESKRLQELTPVKDEPKDADAGGDKPYTCQHCNKVFTRSWNFQRHVLIHTGQKPYKCQKCPKAFALAAHLKIHNRIHTGEKPYTCNICCRGFAQLTNLQRHILTHTGEKPHKCQYCPKAFVSSSDLRRHVRIHTGERPYKCKQCTKAFTTSGNLQSHILTHTGEKPYKCNICNWKFISSSNLRTHIRIHHAYYLDKAASPSSRSNSRNQPSAVAAEPKYKAEPEQMRENMPFKNLMESQREQVFY